MTTLLTDEFIKQMKWSADTPESHQTLVVGNVRGFAGFVARSIEELKVSRNLPGMSGGEYDKAIDDIIALLVPIT